MKTRKKWSLFAMVATDLFLTMTMPGFSATRTWNNVGTDMNSPANYDAGNGGALLPGDDLVFSSGSVGATASADLNVGSVTTTTGYAGNWSIAGKTLTASGNVTFSGPGGVNLGNGITMNGASAVLTIGSNLGTVTAASCALTFNGTTGCVLTDNKTTTFKTLMIGPGAKLTNNGLTGSTFSNNSTPVTLGNNATLTLTKQISSLVTGTTDGIALGSGYTLAGTNSLYILAGANNITITIPGIVTTTGLVFRDNGSFTNVIYEFSGDLTINGNGQVMYMYVCNNYSAITFNFNNHSYSNSTTTGTLATGCSAASGSTATLNYGSSIFNIAIFSNIFDAITEYHNFSNSTWNVNKNWTFGSNHTVNPGTSTVTFTGPGASTITSAGKSFYDVIVNDAGKAFTFAGPASFHNLTTTAMASYSNAGTLITSSGNITFNGAGTLNFGNGITLNEPSSILTISNTVGTIAYGSAVLTINGTNQSLVSNKGGNYWKQISIGNGCHLTTSGTAAVVLNSPSTELVLGPNSVLTLNTVVDLFFRTV